MTSRGVCLLVPGLLGTAVGLLTGNSALSLLSLSVVLWLMLEWLWFQWRMTGEIQSFSIQRTVNDRANKTSICFAGRQLRIAVIVRCRQGGLQPWTCIRDLVPDILTITRGSPGQLVTNSAKQLMFHYDCQPQAAGVASIPGCRFRLQDPNGFFQCDRFVPAQQTLRILPADESRVDPQSQIKRLNSLPQHGIHRLSRAGIGSELLELREYVSGDPPKSIAWKVSARRDRLMTREYESEVPVRTIVFVDCSARTRCGPWGRRLCDASARLAGSISRTALSAGDPAGLVLFSESTIKRLSPGWGDRTLFRILEMLADSCRTDDRAGRWTVVLQERALEVCEERYPELLDTRINRIPWTLFPLNSRKRKISNTRSRLAGVLCQVHQLTVSDWTRLLYDDDCMGYHLSRLLNTAGRLPATRRHPPAEQHNRDSLSHLLQQMTQGIRRAVGQARDNEHYLIVCDLLDAEPLLDIVRPAIQLARARHHRVGIVCPAPSSRGISGNGNDPPTAPILLHEAWQIEQQERRQRLMRELRSLGAEVTFADDDDPLSRTLGNLNLARRPRTGAGTL